MAGDASIIFNPLCCATILETLSSVKVRRLSSIIIVRVSISNCPTIWSRVDASAGGTSITLGGTRSGSLLAGDLIKFANHDKVYMVVADNSDITSGALTIEPPLKSAVSGSAITFDSVPITVRLMSDMQEFQSDVSDKDGELLFSYEIDVVEAF